VCCLFELWRFVWRMSGLMNDIMGLLRCICVRDVWLPTTKFDMVIFFELVGFSVCCIDDRNNEK
jgi:hypothetical protein